MKRPGLGVLGEQSSARQWRSLRSVVVDGGAILDELPDGGGRGPAVVGEDDEEAVVVDVRELVDGQNVRVGFPHPRYLKKMTTLEDDGDT